MGVEGNEFEEDEFDSHIVVEFTLALHPNLGQKYDLLSGNRLVLEEIHQDLVLLGYLRLEDETVDDRLIMCQQHLRQDSHQTPLQSLHHYMPNPSSYSIHKLQLGIQNREVFVSHPQSTLIEEDLLDKLSILGGVIVFLWWIEADFVH